MEFIDIFKEVLENNKLNWCKGECGILGHKRGFVLNADKNTVHLDRTVSTRSTLYRALHEVGHCVNNENGMRRYEQEAAANLFAEKIMKEYGISVPRKTKSSGMAYVARKKRHGDNIRRSK